MTVFLRALLIFCLSTMASVVAGWAQSAAPPQAAAVGYNTRTFGPDLVLGKNWFVTSGANVTQTTSTSITCAGAGSANHWNDHVHTLGKFGVGGGAYMEATLSWDNPYFGYGMAGSDGWPGWWAWTVEHTNWPGYPGYDNTIEVDFMEAWSDTKMSVLMHNWMTAVPPVATDFHYYHFSNSTAHTQQHKFGFLWIPATATSLGHGSFYLDGRKLAGFDVYWKQYDPSLPPPVYFTDNGQPSGAGTAFSIIDKNHLYLILGTGSGNPMHVTSVEVWQKDGTRNLPATAPVSVSVATMPAQVTNASFIVSGTMAGFSSAPTMQYQTNGTGSWQALPAGSTVTSKAFSFTVPGMATNAAAVVSVRDSATTVTRTSNTFAVTQRNVSGSRPGRGRKDH